MLRGPRGARTRTLAVLSAVAASFVLAQGQTPKRMAITLDDLPFGYPETLTITEQRDAVARVLAALERHGITATGFVIGRAVTDVNRELVDAFVRAGHHIGNHSFSHQDLGKVTVDEYVRDIQRGAEAIGPWVKGPHYFRYPFLRRGDTVEKRDAVARWLIAHDVVVAPVTIDNNDYEYNRRLVDAKAGGREIDVHDAYFDHMFEAVSYYEAKGRAITGRAVDQILLLHMNYLNGLYLDRLLQRFRDDGWSFITLEEALTDDVYQLQYDYVGVQGAGHLDAIRPADSNVR